MKNKVYTDMIREKENSYFCRVDSFGRKELALETLPGQFSLVSLTLLNALFHHVSLKPVAQKSAENIFAKFQKHLIPY